QGAESRRRESGGVVPQARILMRRVQRNSRNPVGPFFRVAGSVGFADRRINRERNTCGSRLNSLQLPTANQGIAHAVQPAQKSLSFSDGQDVREAVHEPELLIEVGWTLLPLRVVPVAGIPATMEAQRGGRDLVNRLTVSERGQKAQVIRESLFD